MKKLNTEQAYFDSSNFNDPIAMQTEWTPVKRGGANFHTHRLVEISSQRVEFQASLGAKVFYLLFLFVGLIVIIAFSYPYFSTGKFSFGIQLLLPMLVGLIFSSVGATMFIFGTAPIVFDRRRGYYWKGRKAPNQVFRKSAIKHLVNLERIHALQIITENCSGNKSSYYSYELNLVLENGHRINVVDHGDAKRLQDDAALLSDFLEKPIWNAV